MKFMYLNTYSFSTSRYEFNLKTTSALFSLDLGILHAEGWSTLTVL